MAGPIQNECANADERFTCPGCLNDLPFKYGTQTCGECGRDVNCRREMIPSYVAELGDAMQGAGEDEEDGDDEE